MPKIIIGNVDNEHMLGDSECVDTAFRQTTSIVANRMVWLVEEDDIIILPAPMSKEFLDYVCKLKNIDARTVTVLNSSENELDPILLNFATLSNPGFLEKIKQSMKKRVDWSLVPYYFDRTISWLARALDTQDEIEVSNFLRQGGAELLNSKTEFRRLAAAAGVPIARGQSCSSKGQLTEAVIDLLEDTGIVILKQDFNAGGDGNIVITKRLDLDRAAGSANIIHVKNRSEAEKRIAALWPRLCAGRNINVVAEVFHQSKDIYFSDYEITAKGVTAYLTHGEMRMAPLWVGFKIPGPLSVGRLCHLMTGSTALARLVAGFGYRGMINFDAVFLDNGCPIFLEYNGRCGGTTHIHTAASLLMGHDYMDRQIILTRNKVEAPKFGDLQSMIKALGLNYDRESREGIVVMTEDTSRTGTMEYLVTAESDSRAMEIEEVFLSSLRTTRQRAA